MVYENLDDDHPLDFFISLSLCFFAVAVDSFGLIEAVIFLLKIGKNTPIIRDNDNNTRQLSSMISPCFFFGLFVCFHIGIDITMSNHHDHYTQKHLIQYQHCHPHCIENNKRVFGEKKTVHGV